MGMVISVYSKEAFKEYLLPSLNNADYSITLYKNYFHLKEDLQLQLEVLDNCWKIKRAPYYSVSLDDEPYNGQILRDQDVWQIETKNKEDISIIVKDVASGFHVYKKYKLDRVREITIGSGEENDICYNYLGMVSKKHARIERTDTGFRIVNMGPNGTYVNSLRIDGETPLEFGDYINIIGLHFVFLGNMIAIDTEEKTFTMNTGKLREYYAGDEKTMLLRKSHDISSGKKVYHRAPRNYEKIVEDRIEIEGPPQLNRRKEQSVFMVAAPALTMALPMLLGCLMMVYASGQTGGSSLYMYSGLVMSLSSAVIGVVWSLVNLRYQRREDKEQEEYRIQAYSRYLIQKTDDIRNRYEQTAMMLDSTYPDAENCLKYDDNKGILWNRNRTHEDFLQHRLGKGDIPFQISIDIPAEKFSLYRDELAEKPAFIKKNYETLYDVPITLDLVKHNLIGLVGGKDKKGAIQVARILSAQIMANNCYTDVKLGYIFDESSSSDFEQWKFAKWAPHVWSEDKKTRFVASGKDGASDVFYELTKVFRQRTENDRAAGREELPLPYYIIFISDISILEGELFAKYVFERNSACGLTTVLLAERYEELPNSCEFIIENTDSFKGMYDVSWNQTERQIIDFDSVEDAQLEKFTRHLSDLQVVEMEEGGEIPDSLTFFDMLKISRPEEIPVKELWIKNRTYENIRGMIGEKAGGSPCYLDVHEKYHGPHGLIAGTTGSGKSETLQTYMLSLAVNYSPDDIAFFIIDYKGGGMANLFNGLPHMIGQISNLSGNQVKRAMISIKSENRRRQRIFTEHGVNNINAYTKLYKNSEASQPVPHLFIIIDEFAELQKAENDFMQELISVAQVGRSLGVHLILATQKPSGNVDANIWSNSRFRLCLRVQDKEDSTEVLHKPDAAYITQAGRCYLQVGNDEVYELFQSGFSGAVYDESMISENTDIAKMLNITGKVDMTGNSVKLFMKKHVELSWIDNLAKGLENALESTGLEIAGCMESDHKMQKLITAFYDKLNEMQMDYAESVYNTARLEDFVQVYGALQPESTSYGISGQIMDYAVSNGIKLPQSKEKTQLDAVKEYLARIAEENGYNHKIQLWMPVLKDRIYLAEFDEYNKHCCTDKGWKEMEGEWKLDVVLGKMDDPENQNQMPLIVDFSDSGHIAVCGSIVSGKSTLLQTMAYALIQKFSPAAVNLYALDFSSRMMDAFEDAPHFGGIMYEDDLEKIAKFFNMIGNILKERKQLFRGGNYEQYVQVNGIKLPAIVILIDNYAAFREKTEGIYEEDVMKLAKEGISHGIYFVISGGGFGINDISRGLADNIKTVLCLSLQDEYAYKELLYNMHIDVFPENGIKGRGLAYYGDRVLEYQTALAVEAENDYQRMEKIRTVCQSMREMWKGRTAKRIPEIPEKPVWSEFSRLEDFDKMSETPDFLPVGYDAANAEVYGIPLRDTYCYTIYGADRTGKTNFMRVCIQSAMRKSAKVCIIDTPDGAMNFYSSFDEVEYISGEQEIFEFFLKLKPVFIERNRLKNRLIGEDREDQEIFDVMSHEIPWFIFISDLSWFVNTIYSAELDMRGFLENIISKGRLHNIYFFSELSVEQYSKVAGYQVFEAFAGHKQGIHFGGKVIDNPVLHFDYLSYEDQNRTEKAGIGILPGSESEVESWRIVVPAARR